ncbi:MAG: hypothetical protein JWN14_1451 [Chthonomonadales bacterium]|nr:hypothetical protein [Chthonomonadales bacterium]
MRKEFIVERQGKTFVLYAGLLDLAHQSGLKSIRTELVQVPSEANNRIAIVTATVVLEKEGVERTFTGIGDAAPNNVAPMMLTCLMRMAETRAKARALRDSVNVGVTAFEELGEEDATDGAPERGYYVPASRPTRPERSANTPLRIAGSSTPAARPSGSRTASNVAETKGALIGLRTEAQADAIRSLCRRGDRDADALIRERFSVEGLDALSQIQASELIRALNDRSAGRSPASAAAS